MMSRSARVAIAAAITAAALACAQAGVPWLSDAELKVSFAGHTIEGVYPDGRSFIEAYESDGRLDYTEGPRTMTGRWSVVADTFCTIYDGSETGGCFRVRRVSANCYEFYFQARSEAEAADPDNARKPSWTARAWRTDALATCKEAPAV